MMSGWMPIIKNYENFIDDDEVTLHRRRRDTDVTDIPGSDVCDELDTQREDWLLRTESIHGARPRQITRERPPLIDYHTGVMDLEASGGTGGGAGRWSSRDSRLLCYHPSDRY